MGQLFSADPKDVLASPLTLIGSLAECADRLRERRERWGYSYTVIPGEKARDFAPTGRRAHRYRRAASVEISCAFPPGPHVVDHIVEAERLGYERAWLFDSPALYGDIWVVAALAAQRTSRIALGPGGARSEPPAPAHAGERDRDARAARAGARRRRDRYRVHRSHGDGPEAAHVGVDAALHRAAACAPARREGRGRRRDRADAARRRTSPRPARSRRPIVIAANGPKGLAVAHELGDGVMTIGGGDPTFEWCSVLAFGTVLDAGESAGFGAGARGRGPGADGRVPRDVRGRSRVGRRAARRRRVAQAVGGDPREPNATSRSTKNTSCR